MPVHVSIALSAALRKSVKPLGRSDLPDRQPGTYADGARAGSDPGRAIENGIVIQKRNCLLILINHLVSMSPGYKCADETGTPFDRFTYVSISNDSNV